MRYLPTHRILEMNVDSAGLSILEEVTKALGSNTRLEILRFLGSHTSSVLEIANALRIPASTAALHINILEKAGLIKTDLQSAKRGVQKICARKFDRIVIQLPSETECSETEVKCEMPIGAYVDISATPTCGLLSEIGFIGQLDDPASFYEPERIKAQLLWFHSGYVEYRFPSRPTTDRQLAWLEVSLEISSEAPLHHDNWLSDITVWINGVEIGTYTSPADFGSERGLLTPLWWDTNNSQYGQRKNWKVDHLGCYIDSLQVSTVTLDDLKINAQRPITIRIGVKEDAKHVGGMNLFGSKFGNYPEDIILKQVFA